MTNIRQTALLRDPAGLAPEVVLRGHFRHDPTALLHRTLAASARTRCTTGSAGQRIVLATEHASPGQPVKDLRVHALAHASSRSTGPGGS
jgi:hypothetical protein